MPHAIGYVDNSGGTLAHYKMLEKIRDVAVASGFWEVMRYNTAVDDRELILKGKGYTGTEEIYVGVRTYQNPSADYYNLCVATFTGYVPSNTFDTQPGVRLSGVPAHNQRIDYWLTVNPQRIACCMKVGTPVYEHFYIGKFFPYARPSQYPYPIVCGGMLNGAAATRFSETSHSMPYKGNRANLGMRFNTGVYLQPETHPWNNTYLAGNTQLRDTNDSYPLLPIILNDANGIYGELDGVRYISGFNNVVENTCGPDWVVLQDVSRTGFIDYIALKLDV
ncbi:hypothetical protein LZP46_01055 [Acinetobacter sp. SCLZS86]|uniref:hypothetical protein n=1 Tax=Acinetobacter sp. SCLZS86 TaxID=2908637 RepID=UPI001F2C99B7|nr:hypothetical protein [Acinetobacter sp. SCLZS86]UIZ57776.1 hypothetical protein LZP46_01055 [Acinetobacter sp. SCLZS86]